MKTEKYGRIVFYRFSNTMTLIFQKFKKKNIKEKEVTFVSFKTCFLLVK